jgi:hypothetical protein
MTGAQMKIYEMIRNSLDGGFKVEFRIKDGIGHLYLPNVLEHVLIPDGRAVEVEFEAGGDAAAPIRLTAWRVPQPHKRTESA